MDWFSVDKEGLGRVLEGRGKAFALFELIQNSWDTCSPVVRVTLDSLPGRGRARLVVEDEDPDGFHDLSHAFTLFADSVKKGDPTKRGRFNFGEKMVLAICISASIASTTGTVYFDAEGRRRTKERREKGSRFEAVIRMTRDEVSEALAAVKRLLSPPGVETVVNGEALPHPMPLATFNVALQTVIVDDEGALRTSKRKTDVQVYEPLGGGDGWIYEMGIPVVETGDRWSVNVNQKVPLTMDRDNVPPSYLRALRTEVLNCMSTALSSAEATAPWVGEALASDDVSIEAVERVIDARYGDKVAIYDPSDVEANKAATARGYTVLAGGSLSREQWANVKKTGKYLPSGTIAPTPKLYADVGPPVDVVAECLWTADQRNIVEYAKALALALLELPLSVTLVDTGNRFVAAYRQSPTRPNLDLNVRFLKSDWFSRGPSVEVDELLIHEFAHQMSGDHLSSDFHDATCRLGAKLAHLARTNPVFFAPFLRGV